MSRNEKPDRPEVDPESTIVTIAGSDASDNLFGPGQNDLSLAVAMEIDRRCDEFESALRIGQAPAINEVLQAFPKHLHAALADHLVALELGFRVSERKEHWQLHRNRRQPAPLPIADVIAGASPEARNLLADRLAEIDRQFLDSGLPHNTGFSPPSSLLHGRYQLVGELGTGGSASVFRYTDSVLQRDVAIKFASSDRSNEGGFAERFQEEARKLARMRHPHIVSVHDAGIHASRSRGIRIPFIVLECISGGTIRAYTATGQSFDICVELMIQIAGALQYAHSEGFIHCDVKPENILFCEQRNIPLLTDFGVALDNRQVQSLTDRPGGTIRYMAPERFSLPNSQLDGRVDLWGLGIIFYELLTGTHPFPASLDRPVWADILNLEPPAPRDVDPAIPMDLEAACLKCLQKDPASRYRSADEFRRDLEDWQYAHSDPGLRVPVASWLFDALTAACQACEASNTRYTTAHTLEVLLGVTNGIATRALDGLKAGFAQRLQRRLTRFTRALRDGRSGAGSFRQFDWYELEAMRVAGHYARRMSSPVISDRHLLLGLLETSSNTVRSMQEFMHQELGVDAWRRLLDAVLTIDEDDDGTPGGVFSYESV